jgi:hypothetical protein
VGGHRASGAGDDLVDGPVDLAAVRADDALLDAIAGGTGGFGQGGYGRLGQDDDQLAAVLAAWRADIEADPMPELVTLDEAVEAVDAGHDARDRLHSRGRRRMPFAVAAAAVVVAFAGLTVAVHGAMPGDALWSISQVAFPSRAQTVEQTETAKGTIVEANNAIRRGDIPAAKQLLQQAGVQIQPLPPEAAAPLQQEKKKAEQSLSPTAPSQGTSTSEPGEKPSKPSSGSSAPSPAAPEGSSSSPAEAPVQQAPVDPTTTDPAVTSPDAVDTRKADEPTTSTPAPPPPAPAPGG